MEAQEKYQALLLEVHRCIHDSAHGAIRKFGIKVPPEALDDYVTDDEVERLQAGENKNLSSPLLEKVMKARAAAIKVISYPPSGTISKRDAQALAELVLTDDQKAIVERIIGEACMEAFHGFFTILDAVSDPALTDVGFWQGVSMLHPRSEDEPMLHDELYATYYDFKARIV